MSHGSAASPDLLARQGGASLARLTGSARALGIVGLGASLVAGRRADAPVLLLLARRLPLLPEHRARRLFFVLVLFVCAGRVERRAPPRGRERDGDAAGLRRCSSSRSGSGATSCSSGPTRPTWRRTASCRGKQPFLNDGFFFIRALFYFVAWSALAVYFSRQSQKQDETGDERISAGACRRSPPRGSCSSPSPRPSPPSTG